MQQLWPGKKKIHLSILGSVGRKKAPLASEIQLFVDGDGMIFRNPRIKAFTRGLVWGRGVTGSKQRDDDTTIKDD